MRARRWLARAGAHCARPRTSASGAAVADAAPAAVAEAAEDSLVNDFVSQAVFYKKRLGREPVSNTASRLVSGYSKDPKVAEALSLL